MKPQVILIWLAALLYVEAVSIFNAGPYKVDQKQVGIDYCPISSRRCMEGKHHRRRIAGTTDWLWNGTWTFIDVYVKPTTTMRVVASFKGSNGHYSTLVDLIRPACDWYEFAKSLIDEVAIHAGYKFDCYKLYPGVYEVTNFRLQPKKHFHPTMIPVLPYGSYKVELKFNNDYRVNCFCFRIILDVVPDIDAIKRNQKLNATL